MRIALPIRTKRQSGRTVWGNGIEGSTSCHGNEDQERRSDQTHLHAGNTPELTRTKLITNSRIEFVSKPVSSGRSGQRRVVPLRPSRMRFVATLYSSSQVTGDGPISLKVLSPSVFFGPTDGAGDARYGLSRTQTNHSCVQPLGFSPSPSFLLVNDDVALVVTG